MRRWRRWILPCALGSLSRWTGCLALLSALAMAAPLPLGGIALAHDPSAPMPGENIKGPFTIKGQVLDLDKKPVAGYPLALYPVLPGKGMDRDNSYYQIPDRDVHTTRTDAQGRFVMTNVIDYPQVKNRIYKLFRGDFETTWPFVPAWQSDIVNLNKATSTTIEVTLYMEPAATVRIILKDRNGRRYTGKKAVSIATGKGRRYVSVANFENGVATIRCSPGDPKMPGRIILLRWEDQTEAKKQAREHGQIIDGMALVTYGIIAQRNLALLPGQTVTAEFTVAPQDLE